LRTAPPPHWKPSSATPESSLQNPSLPANGR
jgi:hypothetical protein